MKKTLNILLLILSIALAATLQSCDKHNINGDLDGMWQVMSVTVKEDGATVREFVPDQRYLCFQLHVCQLRSYGGQVEPSANLIYNGKTLTLDFPESEFGDRLPRLALWGIYSLRTTYTVETLTSSTLVLDSPTTRLTCRKF